MTYWRPLSLAWKALNGMIDRNGIEIAGYIAFTVMLAIFPFMIFVVSIAGFFGETQTGANFLGTMAVFAPPEMMKTLLPAIQQVTQNRSGSLLTIGLALALYSAGSAVSALRLALNLAYGLDENPIAVVAQKSGFPDRHVWIGTPDSTVVRGIPVAMGLAGDRLVYVY